VENFDFYLYTSWYVLVHMHNKRRQELLSVKMIEVCFPRKKIQDYLWNVSKQCWNTTQHIHRQTATRPGKISVMEMLIPVSSCAKNSSDTITLFTPRSADRMVQITEAWLPINRPRACLCHECLYHPEQYLFSTVQLGHFRPSPSHAATVSLSNLM
jgi:hypothetical protein